MIFLQIIADTTKDWELCNEIILADFLQNIWKITFILEMKLFDDRIYKHNINYYLFDIYDDCLT